MKSSFELRFEAEGLQSVKGCIYRESIVEVFCNQLPVGSRIFWYPNHIGIVERTVEAMSEGELQLIQADLV